MEYSELDLTLRDILDLAEKTKIALEMSNAVEARRTATELRKKADAVHDYLISNVECRTCIHNRVSIDGMDITCKCERKRKEHKKGGPCKEWEE